MISLVTACMNREAHLRRSLPHWLTLPGIDEVVVVDWSTRDDISDLLQLDERVRLVRVEDEPRWVLAYAYNLGIAQARGDVIFKCDADCLPSAASVRLPLAATWFYAGDSATGREVGKSCVNGQCLFTRAQWLAVNGYSEVLRRYGHDDTDFYHRLVKARFERRLLSPEHLDFIDHTAADRVANHKDEPKSSAEAYLLAQPGFHESINIMIASILTWGPWFNRARYSVLSEQGRRLTVARDKAAEIPIAPMLHQLAYSQAVRAHVGRICKLSPQRLGHLGDDGCLGELGRFLTRSALHQPIPAQPAA